MINLEIVTPEKKVVDEAVEMVVVPTGKGEIGILPEHAPLISTLKPGILRFTGQGRTERIVVSGGFVEISGDKVSILADIAEEGPDIDLAAAKQEEEEARKVLAEWKGSEEEFEVELDRMNTASARIRLAAGK